MDRGLRSFVFQCLVDILFTALYNVTKENAMKISFDFTNGMQEFELSDDFIDATLDHQLLFLTEAQQAIDRLVNAYISNLTDQDDVVESGS